MYFLSKALGINGEDSDDKHRFLDDLNDVMLSSIDVNQIQTNPHKRDMDRNQNLERTARGPPWESGVYPNFEARSACLPGLQGCPSAGRHNNIK
jgi:hypothetical protein